jgi:hypothetical protein
MPALIDGLSQPLHREFDIRRLQQPPAFYLGLISILGVTIKVFLRQLARCRSFAGEFLSDEGVAHRPSQVRFIDPIAQLFRADRPFRQMRVDRARVDVPAIGQPGFSKCLGILFVTKGFGLP